MPATPVTYYQPETGEIVQVSELFGIDEIEQNRPPGCNWLAGEFDARTHHVLEGVPVPRALVPPMTGATYDLSLLPEGGGADRH